MFDNLLNLAISVFNEMDDFGKQHWGFILCFVFIWWLLDRLISGVRKDVRSAQRFIQKRRYPASAYKQMQNGIPFVPPTPPAPSLPNLSDDFIDSSKHQASSQAGLGSLMSNTNSHKGRYGIKNNNYENSLTHTEQRYSTDDTGRFDNMN